MRLPQSSHRHFSIISVTILLAAFSLLSLTVQAATQQLVCSPSSLRYGAVAVGQLESQMVVLTNTGQTSVTISTDNVSNSEFTISGLNLPAVLAAGQSVSFSIIFAPNAVGWTSGKVTFTSNASNPTLHLSIGGGGVANDALTAAPSTVSFGQVPVGSTVALPVVLTNPNFWKESLTAFQEVGTGFSVSGPALPLVLGGGKSITLQVSFSPQSAGPMGGSVFVAGPGLNIPLSGTGTAIGQLTIAPTALNFGNVNVGSTTTQPSSISAVGGTVIVSSASSNNSQFAVTGASFPLTINAGQTVGFDVVFSPNQSGTYSGSVNFSSNASNSPSEALSGTGVQPQYSVNLSWNPSTSQVAGYNVYRGATQGTYSKINTALDPTTTYIDGTVASGSTYYYAATAVNSSGQESTYSSPVKVAIP